MEIRRVQLENIGCFTDKTFNFSNLTVVSGDNSTGKSTLVYSLFFVLFGVHLNSSLKSNELCRKGEQFGFATLYFNDEHESYKLRRPTEGGFGIYKKIAETAWQPVFLDKPGNLKPYIPISSEVASLGSFFREGELIYFLQDIPKYNKTLLQNLIGIDDALIVQSRFKKVFSKAKEVHTDIKKQKETVEKRFPKDSLNYHAPEQLKRGIAELEANFQHIQVEKEKIALDPEKFKALQQRYEEKKKNFEEIVKSKEKTLLKDSQLLSIEELEKKKIELEKQLAEKDAVYTRQKEVERQRGADEQKARDVQSNYDKLFALKEQPLCHVCKQPISKEHLETLISKLEEQVVEAVKNKMKNGGESKEIEDRIKEFKAKDREIKEIEQQVKLARYWDEQIRQLKAQSDEAEQDIKLFKVQHPNIDVENLSRRKKQLSIEQDLVYKQIHEDKKKLTRLEDSLKEIENINKKLRAAERHETVCNVAYRAVETAIRELGGSLLVRIRESIQAWGEHFEFLNQFDIEITNKELLPIIRAKNYQYKLNQMSKSERIFLYLMLKLAIGDALGNLGVFVLDDPADGLDMKRKEMLAYLLTEISRKRQIVVTTNDASFAELFSECSRITL